MAKINPKKLVPVAVLLVLLCSSLASMANARIEDNSTQNGPVASEEPPLIATRDNVTATSDDSPVLFQERDNSTIAGDSSPADANKEAQSNDEPVLISTLSQPDNTGFIIAGIALVAAIAVSAAVIISRKRKK